MNAEVILSATGLVKRFGSGHTEVRAVDDVALTVGRGELVLVMGPSGSGKTTLLSMLGGLLRPSSGRIDIGGTDITALGEAELPEVRAREVGFIFQAFNLIEALTVEENILFPATLLPGGMNGARRRGGRLIERLGLGARRRSKPRTLSGGEKQRVAIARALINQPRLILADEPTGNLDSENGQEVMMILHDISRDEGRSVIMVTHDPRVEDVADRVLWLNDGRLTEGRRTPARQVRDPVCGMRVDEAGARWATSYGGTRFAFCSQRCLRRFTEHPGRYLAGGRGGHAFSEETGGPEA